jgi:hypothetical protein
MKFLLAYLFLFSTLIAAPQNEISTIEELIETTKKNLDSQQKLLTMFVEFKEAREVFLADPYSGRAATMLVKRAMRLYTHMEKEHLTHLFSADLLTELAFYNQLGKQVAR